MTQIVDKSASADLRTNKMLIDMMKDVEHKAGHAVPPPEPTPPAGRGGQGTGAEETPRAQTETDCHPPLADTSTQDRRTEFGIRQKSY